MELRDFLAAVMSGGILVGPLVFAAFEYLEWGKGLAPKFKRIAVAAVSAFAGVSAWAVSALLGYIPMPEGATAISEAIWTHGSITALAAFTSSSVIHGLVATPTVKTAKGESLIRNEPWHTYAAPLQHERCEDADCWECPFNPTCQDIDNRVQAALRKYAR